MITGHLLTAQLLTCIHRIKQVWVPLDRFFNLFFANEGYLEETETLMMQPATVKTMQALNKKNTATDSGTAGVRWQRDKD